jgi:gliding motility-associated-like protein
MKINTVIVFLVCLTSLNGRLFSQAPTATIVLPGAVLCSETVYTFSSVVTGSITSYSWSVLPSSGAEILGDNGQDALRFRFVRSGTFSVSLFVANSAGTFTAGQLFTVNLSARASYNASFNNSGFPTNLVLSNSSKNAVAFLWDFGAAAPSQTITNVAQTYTAPGAYSVSLVAYGVNGCNDTLNYNFEIDGFSEVKLPNVFTPNNDGVNDIFKPITRGLAELKVWVYSRHGMLMHHWVGVNGFWDGHSTAGEECPDDVYFYILEAKGFDGKEYKLKSNLTLIR